MKKFDVYVSGSIRVPVSAKTEEEAREMVESVCAAEKSLDEVGLSGNAAQAILEVSEWVIDVYEVSE